MAIGVELYALVDVRLLRSKDNRHTELGTEVVDLNRLHLLDDPDQVDGSVRAP